MRTRKTVIVLISGKAGAGKTTVASLLEEKLKALEDLRVKRYALASPIKFVAKFAFGWDGEKDADGRKLLQSLGAVGREYNIDVWCDKVLEYIDALEDTFPPNFILIDDWRFINEYEFFSRNPTLDTFGIRVNERGSLTGALAEDISETSLPEYLYTGYKYIIDNSGTIEDLETKIGEIFESLKKNYIVE